MHILYTFIATLFLTIATLPSSGQASLLGDNSHIQLKHVMASVQSKPGALTSQIRPLTPILTVPNGDNVAFVCQRAPRAAEAILFYFSKYPAPVDRTRHIDLDAMKQHVGKLAAYVNHALGKDVVSEVYVIEGGKSMGSGVMSRLPFAQTQGCGRVMEEYEQRMKELLGDKKK